MSKKISVTDVRKTLRLEMKAMAEYYRAPPELDQRFEDKLRGLPAARTEADRGLLLIAKARVLTGYQTYLLSQWAKGKIDGPRTVTNLLDLAKGKERNAKRMDSLEKPEKAQEYRQQAQELRAEADAIVRARREATTSDEGLEEFFLAKSSTRS